MAPPLLVRHRRPFATQFVFVRARHPAALRSLLAKRQTFSFHPAPMGNKNKDSLGNDVPPLPELALPTAKEGDSVPLPGLPDANPTLPPTPATLASTPASDMPSFPALPGSDSASGNSTSSSFSIVARFIVSWQQRRSVRSRSAWRNWDQQAGQQVQRNGSALRYRARPGIEVGQRRQTPRSLSDDESLL